MGIQQRRFRKPIKNLQDREVAQELPGDGTIAFEYERPYAWCFDYEKLVERMGLNLVTEFVWQGEIDDEKEENENSNNNNSNSNRDVKDYKQDDLTLF